MKQAPDIRFVAMQPSDTFALAARERAARLDRFCPVLMACRVTFSVSHKHRHRGRPFGVQVTVTLPGHELAVNRVENENVYLALGEAFDDMTRRIEDAMRRMRGQGRLHESPAAEPESRAES